MAIPYVGEIRMFAGNFSPAGWLFCEGQLLSVDDNLTLFQLIGTTYGGDGENTFGLPDLRGRIPVHFGDGYSMAETFGTETVTLTTAQIPSHSHSFLVSSSNGGVTNPSGSLLARNAATDGYSDDISAGLVALNPNSISSTGGSQPHNNMAPFICVSFIISLYGIFPSET
jgi:microcystin-dependent protein